MTEHRLGKGTWELDAAHFPRPTSRLTASMYETAFPLGFAEDTARNGLLLDRLAYGQHAGFMYNQVRVVGAPAGAPPPPKWVLQLLSRLHPGIRERTRTAEKRHVDKPWRTAMKEWNEVIKPQRIAAHRALLRERPQEMSGPELADHLARCAQCYEDSVRQHGRFTISCQVTIGELIVKLQDWAGIDASDALSAVQSFSPVSAGDEPVASALLSALQADARALDVLSRDADPGAILAELSSGESEVAQRLGEYLDVVGERALNNYDVAEPRGVELPFLIVEGLRARLRRPLYTQQVHERAEQALSELLEKVPEAHHDELRYLVDEARAVAPLRDERVLYGDYWSAGVMRRGLLELGARLQARGQLEQRVHATLFSLDEALAAARGEEHPNSSEMAERWRQRKKSYTEDAPRHLGPEPVPPPPAAWLPAGLRMSHRATLACLAANFAERTRTENDVVVRGIGVSAGVYEGPARLVVGPDDFHRLRPGDVLVTRSTSPTYNVVLPLLGALVTDRGGALSHAAIVSREFGIPGVVGCVNATRQLIEGMRVRVDGRSGECRVVG
ncbi:MAG TPA: PEP-utilizing enzyme [Polyangiaceae bacterium]|nr:PEP-utilizing enzyme [Polyangiaceae bacterium]